MSMDSAYWKEDNGVRGRLRSLHSLAKVTRDYHPGSLRGSDDPLECPLRYTAEWFGDWSGMGRRGKADHHSRGTTIHDKDAGGHG